MSNIHYITSGKLDFVTIEKIINEKLEIRLSEEAKSKIQKCRTYLDKKIENVQEPIYGITTGFGALHDITISKDELSQLQTNLVMSHASGTGDEVEAKIIKLMLFFKVQALSYGHSGVQLETVERILDFYNNDVIPVVYQLGSLGASGDLAPLAHLFLPLLGLGEVRYGGKRQPAEDVLKRFKWKPIILRSKEGLALLNGTQFMSAHGVTALLKAFRLSKFADTIAAISLEAFDGRIDPFFDEIHQIRPHNVIKIWRKLR